MPLGSAYFPLKNLRALKMEFRVDRAARYMPEFVLNAMHYTRTKTLHAFLFVCTGCTRPRAGQDLSSRIKEVVNNLDGLDLHPENDEENDASDNRDSKLENETHTGNRAPTRMDLQNAVKTITSLLPEDTRLAGEEREPFILRLDLTFKELETPGLAPSHHSSVLFLLLMESARKACKELNLHSLSLHAMIDDVQIKLLFDGEIKGRRVTTWTSLTFNEFRKLPDCEEKATRRCLKFVVDYQRDLSKHMLAE